MCKSCKCKQIETRQDLREYSDGELSLIVMNNEGLYNMRIQLLRNTEILNELFIFNKEQLEDLIETIEADLAE